MKISFLFKIIKNYFIKEIDSVINQGIKVNIFGNINGLSKDSEKL